MAERRLTEEQRAAIGAEGEVLVSASAGSGKDVRHDRADGLPRPLGQGGGVGHPRGYLYQPRRGRDEGAPARGDRRARQRGERSAHARAPQRAALADRHGGHQHRALLLQPPSSAAIFTRQTSPAPSACWTMRRRKSSDRAPSRAPSTGCSRAATRVLRCSLRRLRARAGSGGCARSCSKAMKRRSQKPTPAAFLGGIPALYDDAHFAALCEELFSPRPRACGKAAGAL